MKKVLHICNHDFYLIKFLKPIILEQLNNGYEVHVVCKINDPNFKFFDGVKIHNISYPISFFSVLKLIKSIGDMVFIIKKNNFFIVISHNRIASFVGRIASYICRIPIRIYFAHGFYFHDDQNKISKFITIQLERLLSKITSYTLSQSIEDLNFMTKLNYIKKNKISYVGNGIDEKKFSPVLEKNLLREKLDLPTDSFLICAVGRLVKGKGFQDLIRAFSIYNKKDKNSYLIIVGGNVAQDISKYENKILRMTKKLGIKDHIIMTGMVNNVQEYLGCSNVFVSASYREGISKSMLEAMNMEIPVVVSNIRGSREVIQDEFNGLLFKSKDFLELSQKLIYVKNNIEIAKKISKNARNLVQSFFTEKKYTKRQIDIFKKISEQTIKSS